MARSIPAFNFVCNMQVSAASLCDLHDHTDRLDIPDHRSLGEQDELHFPYHSTNRVAVVQMTQYTVELMMKCKIVLQCHMV